MLAAAFELNSLQPLFCTHLDVNIEISLINSHSLASFTPTGMLSLIFTIVTGLFAAVGLNFLFATDEYKLYVLVFIKRRKCLTPRFSHKVLRPKEDEKNGQQTSDLILEGGLHAPHLALSFGIYISCQILLYTQLSKESLNNRQ